MSSLLLETLQEGLDDEYIQLLNSDSTFAQDAEKYLSELLVNDDLLSTDPYTTASGESSYHKKTLTEEIAELDMSQHEINAKLSTITNSNRDLIIDISNDLQFINHQITKEYSHHTENLVKSITGEFRIDLSTSNHFNLKTNVSINNTILNNIDSVLDILELPTLCKLCILQGNYQESLEISTYIQSLMIRYPKITLFKTINEQIDYELKVMIKGLIKLLNTNLKQNHILKIFQILHKLFDDNENQIIDNESILIKIFLNSRFKFIINEISSLKPLIKFNKLTYLKRYIEIYREFMFNSLSIYNIIFKNKNKSQHKQKQKQIILINQFIQSLVKLLCQEFKQYLPDIKTKKIDDSIESEFELKSSIDGLILQLIYLCRSLTGFGLDFEPIILLELVCDDLIPESDWLRNLSKVKIKNR
ncbi:conserved oligomeric Golgi complex component, putative [Candida dubliniensis CD36]|uniref:Conserved oligomeric Golgi complex subunit 8 n=1 Tax=Candida dubliniensis (strain CD36 / ATCC MYA-646 / CBS 7987 / NCPF 3949 / NRRL Y-17841) TaxID=573826 RepID=B9WBV2_CANDC|nr:conserved oligomeric Golgi complex component, putative [Candida dubliniensis CD36]CAX43874.1 conserved oligomeric Golgi complex component, putative [Candida dubliniensis CD36]